MSQPTPQPDPKPAPVTPATETQAGVTTQPEGVQQSQTTVVQR